MYSYTLYYEEKHVWMTKFNIISFALVRLKQNYYRKFSFNKQTKGAFHGSIIIALYSLKKFTENDQIYWEMRLSIDQTTCAFWMLP